MTNTPATKQTIGNALIWAAMMIASSLVIEDSKAASTMMFLLIAGWIASSSLFGGLAQSARAECAAVKRLFVKPDA